VTFGSSVVLSEYSGSSTNKTGRHDLADILLKVALNTITITLINHRHACEMASMFDSGVVDRGLDAQLSKIKDYETGIC